MAPNQHLQEPALPRRPPGQKSPPSPNSPGPLEWPAVMPARLGSPEPRSDWRMLSPSASAAADRPCPEVQTQRSLARNRPARRHGNREYLHPPPPESRSLRLAQSAPLAVDPQIAIANGPFRMDHSPSAIR